MARNAQNKEIMPISEEEMPEKAEKERIDPGTDLTEKQLVTLREGKQDTRKGQRERRRTGSFIRDYFSAVS